MRGGSAGGEAEFGEHADHVRSDGALADGQPAAYLAVDQSVGDKGEDIALLLGQRGDVHPSSGVSR
jgi:alpha-D-ribose 1-methylphosphonate 5-triphosphate synthase subunit PhnI